MWMSERNHLMFWCVKLCGNLLPIASMKLLLLPLSANIASCTKRKRLLSSYPSVFLSSCTHLPVLSSNLRFKDSKQEKQFPIIFSTQLAGGWIWQLSFVLLWVLGFERNVWNGGDGTFLAQIRDNLCNLYYIRILNKKKKKMASINRTSIFEGGDTLNIFVVTSLKRFLSWTQAFCIDGFILLF